MIAIEWNNVGTSHNEVHNSEITKHWDVYCFQVL